MTLTFKPHNAKKAETLDEAIAECKRPVLEPKYDGWRFIVIIDTDGDVSVWSRTGKPYKLQTPEPIMDELRRFPPNTILDGEMVDGTHNRNCVAVTNVFGKSKAKALAMEADKIQYILFDCLEIDGHDLKAVTLQERRVTLETYLVAIKAERVALTPQAPAEHEYAQLMLEQDFEGVMVKDLDAPYAIGKRGHGWFKIKSTVDIDVVIMGMELDGAGQHEGKVGRFVVGQYVDGKLVKRAAVNPYDDAMRNDMTHAAVSADTWEGNPMMSPNKFIGKVCTIKHYGVLKDGLRHPTFVTWREDKPAEECGFDNG